MMYENPKRHPFRVVRDGNAITFYDAAGEPVDLLVVLSQTVTGQIELLIDDFSVRLEGARLERAF